MNSLKNGKFNNVGKKLGEARLAEAEGVGHMAWWYKHLTTDVLNMDVRGFLKYFRDKYGGKPIGTEA